MPTLKSEKMDLKKVEITLKASKSPKAKDVKAFKTEKEAKLKTLDICGVTEDEYTRAGGRL